jgi:hypothetical protein
MCFCYGGIAEFLHSVNVNQKLEKNVINAGRDFLLDFSHVKQILVLTTIIPTRRAISIASVVWLI